MSAPESFEQMVERLRRPFNGEYEDKIDHDEAMEFARAVAKWQATKDAEIADGLDEWGGQVVSTAIRDEAAKL